ncbi:MAG: carbohydrate ABC transporter permease [Acholeplasmataceae bacterium]|jgi:multiple sugar transport system permease protein|nr:carbohydrate ABC transporter permease [Acholeplasmataceae bacterium]
MKQSRIKRKLFGRYGNDGLIFKLVLYLFFIGISFIFLYPILQMIVTSFMTLSDLVDPTTIWIPKQFTFKNYIRAFEALNVLKALKDSFIVTLSSTAIIVVSSAFIGYGFASYDFPFKKIMMGILVAMFLIPTILMSIPTYVIYQRLNILNSLKAFIYPAMLGFGFRQTIFILIFYQFFKDIPIELREAATIDGASELKIFFKVCVPLALPAFLITSLYAFVWYWNETGLALLYLSEKYTTLPMAVLGFRTLYELLYPAGTVGLEGASETFNQGVQFAGTMISILPLLIIYFVAQKWFIEGIDRTGIAGD